MAGTLGSSTDRLLAAPARSAFRIEYSTAQRASESHPGSVLLEIHYGAKASPPAASTACVWVQLEALHALAHERWIVPGPVERAHESNFELATSGNLLAGFATSPSDEVERDTRDLYERMLGLVSEREHHLLRVWNVLPRLNERSGELDRYMLFCRGRAEAFEERWGARFAEHLCAFSAVGSRRGPQVLYFLACRDAGVPRENPRQVPAWSYPACHGPRSPSFARAMRGPDSLDGTLFVSGTASVVGHESRHRDDVAAQARETLRNIQALLGGPDGTKGILRNARFSPVKAYLRHAEDRPIVQAILAEELGEATPVLYLRADICRPELLVEIEGLASEAIDPPPAGFHGAT